VADHCIAVPLMRFRAPSAHRATGSDLHRGCLARLCCAFRLSQPPDALFLPRPFQLCFTLVAPLGFALQRFVPPAKPTWSSDQTSPPGVVQWTRPPDGSWSTFTGCPAGVLQVTHESRRIPSRTGALFAQGRLWCDRVPFCRHFQGRASARRAHRDVPGKRPWEQRRRQRLQRGPRGTIAGASALSLQPRRQNFAPVRRSRSDPQGFPLRKAGPPPALRDVRLGRDPMRRERRSGPAGDDRIFRLVASAGSGSVVAFGTEMGLQASAGPTLHHVTAIRRRFGLVCHLVSAPRASPLPPAAAQAASGCPAPPVVVFGFGHPKMALGFPRLPAGWIRLQGFEPRKSPYIHPSGVTHDDWSRSSLGISPPWGFLPSCHDRTKCPVSSRALQLRGRRSDLDVCASESQ